MALSEYKWAKDELLKDMDISIEKAMAEHMTDLVGALLRLNASAHDWCERSDCGPCPLAVMKCQSGMDERVEELILEYENKKKAAENVSIEKPADQQPAEQEISDPKPSSSKPSDPEQNSIY